MGIPSNGGASPNVPGGMVGGGRAHRLLEKKVVEAWAATPLSRITRTPKWRRFRDLKPAEKRQARTMYETGETLMAIATPSPSTPAP